MIPEEIFPLDFILILFGIFATSMCLVVGYALFRQWKRNRLTSARKDYYR